MREDFALVEWLGENMFSVLPLCCAKEPRSCKAGSCMDFRWYNPESNEPSKFYKALILKISGESQFSLTIVIIIVVHVNSFFSQKTDLN